MRDSWLHIVDSVLRPARPRLARCLKEGELHQVGRRLLADDRGRALADCARRIETARATVLAADDGVISGLMTELEREWRRLSRTDPDQGLMELWARIAPARWIDRKRWRDGDAARAHDTAIALASDVAGVEAAEAAVASLRVALAAWGTQVGARVRWCFVDGDVDCVSALLEEPARAATEASAARLGCVVAERALQLQQAVRQAALSRFAQRPLLSESLARAAAVDFSLHAAALAARPNPVTPLRELWLTGYALAAIDDAGVTLEIPRL